MRIKRAPRTVMLLMTYIAFMIGTAFSEVHAANFALTPQEEISVANVGDLVTFDLDLTTETDSFSYNFWDFDFTYDSAELTFNQAETTYGRGMNGFFTEDDLSGNLRLSADLPFFGPDLEAPPGHTYDVASIAFTVSSIEVFDGLADFSLLSQIGTSGAGLRGFSDLFGEYQFGGAQGADVGAVPVPGSLWLLGSGLIGLAGLRKRLKA